MTTAPELAQSDAEELLAEIRRYLDAVDVFRAENCEPAWTDGEALVA